jgi:amino acid transporter
MSAKGNTSPQGGSSISGLLRIRKVAVLTTAMLTFIPFWKAGAVVLCDLGSSAFYAGGIAMRAFGEAFPWYIMLVMLFAGIMIAVYVESCALFVRGGTYKIVKEGLGHSFAKVSVSALMFDYVLTGPISAVSAGHYMSGFLYSVFPQLKQMAFLSPNLISVVFALIVIVIFWRLNIRGIEESSSTSTGIISYAILVGLILLIWSGITLAKKGGVTLPPFKLNFTEESMGWLNNISWLKPIGAIGIIMAFGHSILALSGLETMAQVYREIEFPKMKNLKKLAISMFVFALLFTGFLTFVSALIIPSNLIVSQYADNLLAGLAMNLMGPEWMRMVMQVMVVVAGVVMLSGAVNTAMVGSNGVLNRVAEDGILTDWFRQLHPKHGTTYRIVNMIAIIQIGIILLCGGNVYLLGEAYAFGVLWSFVCITISIIVLRFKDKTPREWMFPLNIKIQNAYFPIGLVLVFAILLATSSMNLITKKIATVSGLSFTVIFYLIFYFSEKLGGRDFESFSSEEHEERLNVKHEDEIKAALECLTKDDRVLIAVKNEESLYHFEKALETLDDEKTDILVAHSQLAKPDGTIPHSSSEAEEENKLFTKVVLLAEKYGQKIVPFMVSSNDAFYSIAQLAKTAKVNQVIMGVSGKLGADEQLERLVMAWGAIHGSDATDKEAVSKTVLIRIIWEGREVSYELI